MVTEIEKKILTKMFYARFIGHHIWNLIVQLVLNNLAVFPYFPNFWA